MKKITRQIGIPTCVVVFLIFLSIPTFAKIAVVGELTHEYTAQPGDENRGSIVLHNKGDEPESVKLTIKDYRFSSDGKTFYLEPGSVERSNASWITLERSRVTIPPDGKATINYTLRAPDDISMKGTYWSIIMVEPVIDEQEYLKQGRDINVSIHEIVRFGIQIVASIGSTGEKKIKFGSTSLSFNDENLLMLNIDLENSGERWLRPNVWVDIFREDGSRVGRYQGTKKRIFPGTSIRQELKIGDLEQGKYMALVVADGGDEFIVGAEYTLNIK
jgi:hypothetical protein